MSADGIIKIISLRREDIFGLQCVYIPKPNSQQLLKDIGDYNVAFSIFIRLSQM